MWWLIPAITAGLNFVQAGQKNKQRGIENKLQSEITRYGYLTGRQGNVDLSHNNPLNDAINGAIQGASIAQGLKGTGWFGADDVTGKPADLSAGTANQTEFKINPYGNDYKGFESGWDPNHKSYLNIQYK